MNPYTAQVIGQAGGQFLRSRGKDAQRERMLRLIQLDNEQKKLASFLKEQKQQQEDRDARAKAAQDKIAEQTKIRNAQEQMRLEVLRTLAPREIVAGPMAAIPGALAALDQSNRAMQNIPPEGREDLIPVMDKEWRAKWYPDQEPSVRPEGMSGPPMSEPALTEFQTGEEIRTIPPVREAPTPLSSLGVGESRAEEKGMDSEMARFLHEEMVGARPDDVDTVAKDIRKEMFKAAPKDKKPSFIKTWFKPDERPDTRKAGGFDIVYPAQNIDNETLKFFARQDGIDLTDEEIDQLHASINIRGSAGVTPSPLTEGQQFTPALGMTMREWDGNGPPPLPGMSLPPGVEPGSPAAQEFQYEAGRAAEKTKKTKSESAQTAAQFILEGIGDRERINRYTQLKGDPEKWAALPIETQAAIEAKVSVLRNREAQKANKPKGGAKGWEGMTQNQQEEKRSQWRKLASKLSRMESLYFPAKRANNPDIQDRELGNMPYTPEEYKRKIDEVRREKAALEAAWGYDNLWKNSGFKYTPYKKKGKPSGKKVEPKLNPVGAKVDANDLYEATK